MAADWLVYLKVKRLNLLQEHHLIRGMEEEWALRLKRTTERAARGDLYGLSDAYSTARDTLGGLKSHRVTVVRNEIRAAHLADGFLKGTHLREMEREGSRDPDLRRVREIAYSFRGDIFDGDDQVFEDLFDEWCEAAGFTDKSLWARKKRKRKRKLEYTFNSSPEPDEPEEEDSRSGLKFATFVFLTVSAPIVFAIGFIVLAGGTPILQNVVPVLSEAFSRTFGLK
jgi:hypothetical protein